MTKFHSDDYIKFLRSIRPDNMGEYSKLLQRLVFHKQQNYFIEKYANFSFARFKKNASNLNLDILDSTSEKIAQCSTVFTSSVS